MKAALLRALLFCAGLSLVAWFVLPAGVAPAGAAPRLLVTETATGEPATPTPTNTTPPTSTPTATTATATATATEIGGAPPTSTSTSPPPTSTPPPPPPPPPDDPPTDRERSTATPTPTASPAASATAEVVVDPQPDPAIEKSVSPGAAIVGERAVYTLTVTNLGAATATGVRVSDTLPAFVRPVEATATRGEARIDGQSVQVTIGDLAPGETVTITIVATVVALAPPDNRNLATVTSDTPDANPANNQASVPLDTVGPVALPETGGERGLPPIVALLLGLALIAASLLVSSGAARARE